MLVKKDHRNTFGAIKLLKVSRIDHGNHASDDENLVIELARQKIPLTLCPLSNLKLGVVKSLEEHPLKKMIEKRLLVTVNSDDPAYFGGYINENYIAVQKALGLNADRIFELARNSFLASFLSEQEKQKMLAKLEAFRVRGG